MIVVLSVTKVRPEAAGPEYDETLARMEALVRTMPGYLGTDDWVGADGSKLSAIKFESEEALEAWRTHPEHLEAQRRGIEHFYESYSVQVCRTIREYSFSRAALRDSSSNSR